MDIYCRLSIVLTTGTNTICIYVFLQLKAQNLYSKLFCSVLFLTFQIYLMCFLPLGSRSHKKPD